MKLIRMSKVLLSHNSLRKIIYPANAWHIFAENAPVKRQNDNYQQQTQRQPFTIPLKNEVPRNTKISEKQNWRQSETGGLASLLELKINAKLMLITNIDIGDRLIKRQVGVVKNIEIKKKCSQSYIFGIRW